MAFKSIEATCNININLNLNDILNYLELNNENIFEIKKNKYSFYNNIKIIIKKNNQKIILNLF